MNRKLELLEEKKKNWMASKAISELTEQVSKETASDVKLTRTTGASNGPKSATSAVKSNETDIFLNRLTDKLTDHIRDELRREMQMNLKHEDVRDKVAQKMESYLEAELSTHTCKICFELMVSPHHTPILLFPCGHTFCQQCIDTHVGSSSATSAKNGAAKKSCPYCRTPIESRAVNQSLRELIDQFSRQQNMVKNQTVQHLDQVFPVRTTPPKSSSSRPLTHSSHRQSEAISAEENRYETSSSKYTAQLKSCEVRYVILKKELEEVALDQQQTMKRKAKIKAASDHLTQERSKIDHKIALLQEERDLIDKHLTEQQRKQDELRQTETVLMERSQLVRSTLINVQAEMEKLELIVEGLQGMDV